MACPDDSLLARLADGRLQTHEAWVAEHVGTCERCAAAVKRMTPGDPTVSYAIDHAAAPPAPPKPAVGPGAQVGRYQIREVLGEGGMGRVYVAFDPQLSREVALKLILPDEASPDAEARLLREAQALARLTHPNVVAAHDAGRHDGHVFVAMERVRGQNLKAWLAERQRPWREVLQIFLQAGEGLAAAHAAGLVHRDFKPPNVVLGNDGRVRVVDFGIARAAQDGPRPDDAARGSGVSGLDSGRLTAHGAFVGTVGYIALESFKPEGSDARADQFSYCVSLYEALAGKRPFPTREGVAAYLNAIERGAPSSVPAEFRGPAWLYRVVAKGLSPDPGQRFADMPSLLRTLERGLSRPRRLATAALISSAVLALCLGAALSLKGRAARDCVKEAAAIDAAWNPQVKARIGEAFASTGRRAAAGTLERVEKLLDAYTASWREQSRDVCTKLEAAQAGSDRELLSHGQVCLERARAELNALTDVLSTPNVDILWAAVDAIHTLIAPARCRDPGYLRMTGYTRVLTDGERQATHALLDSRSKMTAVCHAGRSEACLEQIIAVEAVATDAGLLDERAQALVERAGLDGDNPTVAAKEAGEAHVLALRASNIELAVWAGAEAVIHSALFDAPEARKRLEALKPFTANIDPYSETGISLVEAQAGVLNAEGNSNAAVDLLKPALEGARKSLGAGHFLTLRLMTSLSAALDLAGRAQESFAVDEQALAIIADVLGPDHFRWCVSAGNLTYGLIEQGRYDAAVEMGNKALECARGAQRKEFYLAFFNWNLSYALRRAGRAEEALAAADLAVRYAGTGTADSEPDLLEYRGRALAAVGHLNEALEQCRAALARAKQIHGEKHVAIAAPLACVGNVQLLLDRPGDARASLEQAYEVQREMHAFTGDRSDVAFALAQATWAASKNDRARAVTLAREALEDLSSLPDRADDRAAINAWLASHESNPKR